MNDEGGLSDDENVPDCWEELITNCSENSLSEEEEREEHEEEEDYVLFMSDVHIINSSSVIEMKTSILFLIPSFSVCPPCVRGVPSHLLSHHGTTSSDHSFCRHFNVCSRSVIVVEDRQQQSWKTTPSPFP
jgi:hypothetical protein